MNLPCDLQDVLFFLMEAKYAPNGLKARRNAYDDEEQLRKYLGTYFPRSWVEQYRLWQRLLKFPKLLDRWSNKDKIKILDIGSGTGGNAHGIVDALKCSPLGLLPLEIHVVDINSDALALQKQVFDSFMYAHFNWNSHQHQFALNAEAFQIELAQLISACGGSFDVILTSKFLNEIATYTLDAGNSPLGFFKAFILEADQGLNQDGVALIVDVAVSIGSRWVPTMLNQEWHEARKMGINLATILPRTCGHYESVCGPRPSCFQFTPLEVLHQCCPTGIPDRTNIVFKVLARQAMTHELLSEAGDIPITTMMSQRHNSYCIKGTVSKTPGNSYVNSPWD